MTPSAGQIAVRTDACPGQMPSSGPTNVISSGMPEHDSWDEGRLPRSGTFVSLVISTQKQLKSASAGRKLRNSLAGARAETANPCCRASIEDRLRTCLPATTLVRPLSFDLSGMGDPAGSFISRQYSSRGHRGTQAPPPRQGNSQEESTCCHRS